MTGYVLEHESSRAGRWLRAQRTRFALWIAVVEGILVAVHVIPWALALVIAVLAIAAWMVLLRQTRSDTLRQIGWIAAASQALVALVPIFVIIAATLALIAVGILAVVALIVLFADRR
jgi:hypothetical protein